MDDLKEILDAAKAETTIACWADIRPRVSAHCRTTLSSGRATHQLEEMAPDLAAEVLRLRAEVERLTGALTPSCYTKAAYMGEIHCDCPTENWKHFVPWTSIKEIMAMIRARAALKAKGTE